MSFEFRRWLVDGVVEKRLFRGTSRPPLWTGCGQPKNLEIGGRKPLRRPLQDSRNTSLLETETDPGATPEREKNRETGASGG